MVFQDYEVSTESGRPVELFHFSLGTTHYYYTSAPDSFLFGGNTYLPRQITRSSPTQSTEERRQQIEITIPTEDAIAGRFVGIVPGATLFLEISRFHRGDTEAFVLWSGAVVGATYKRQGAECTLLGVTTESAFNRPIPRFKYQGMCNHVLFDDSCKVVQSGYNYSGSCSAAVGSTVTVDGIFTAHGADWMVGGYVNLNDIDYRLVISQDGDVLSMYLPFENDPVAETLECFAGCDHTIVDCNTKFSNLINYGGFPFVPELNPFIVGMD